MVKKRGPGRPPKVKRGRPKGSKNKIIGGLKQAVDDTNKEYNNKWSVLKGGIPLEYVKDYPIVASLRSRLEASVIKFENAVDEIIEQLKGKL